MAILTIIGVVVAAVVVLVVPSLRARAFRWWHEAKNAVRVLRSPEKLLQLFGGNLLSQILFAVALSAVGPSALLQPTCDRELQ